ncbi:MAG: cytochrome c oxidase accessory protein CcoG [Magnetococcales bacterium]|nr:cytochrome c oxidase accessory protein CcoG [Magnetococcales bacterium]
MDAAVQIAERDEAEQPEQPELYASWRKIHPKYQPGFFRRVRWIVTSVLLGLYYILPMLRWDRPGEMPDQAILFDLPGRKFYIFDLVIWPQEVFLLTFLLMAAAFGLFLMTALAGRVFCGYICFQTVWTDLFLWVEHWVEGPPRRRREWDAAPWSLRKIGIRLIKHGLWLLIGVATGGAFVFYFADAPTLLREFLNGTAPYAAWFTLGFLTLGTYVMAGFAREQVCIYMCPYSRFQGAMFDQETLVIAYDEKRGEPRISSRRQRREGSAGDCIDCKECVRVCPTGIDIRDGQQYQCITCAACVDACDSVMDRLRKPRGLVGYTSFDALTGVTPPRFRFRVWLYGALTLGALGAVMFHFLTRAPLELNVLRQRQPLYVALSDGSVRNGYTARLLNMTSQPQTYRLTVEGVKGASLHVEAAEAAADGSYRLRAESGEVVPYTVFVTQSEEFAKLGAQGDLPVQFKLTGLDPTGGSASYHSVFIRPR